MSMYELLIKNGLVVDGTGAPARRADVGISAGKILSVRREAGTDTITALKDYTEGAREYLEANIDLLARYQAQKKEGDALSLYRAMLGDLTKPDSNPPSCCVLLNRLAETSVVDLYAKTPGDTKVVVLPA